METYGTYGIYRNIWMGFFWASPVWISTVLLVSLQHMSLYAVTVKLYVCPQVRLENWQVEPVELHCRAVPMPQLAVAM